MPFGSFCHSVTFVLILVLTDKNQDSGLHHPYYSKMFFKNKSVHRENLCCKIVRLLGPLLVLIFINDFVIVTDCADK